MSADIFRVGSPYLCGNGDVFVIEIHGYGNIVLKINKDGITKPEKETIEKYKRDGDLPKDCKPLFNKDIKDLNVSLRKVDYILLDERDEYTIYEFSYRNLKAYIVENWNGYSAELKFEVFKDKDEATFWVFSK